MPSYERRNCSVLLKGVFCSEFKISTLVHLKGKVFIMGNHECSEYYTEHIGHTILTVKNLSNLDKKLRGANR